MRIHHVAQFLLSDSQLGFLRLEFGGFSWLGFAGGPLQPWLYLQSTSAGVFGIVAGFVTHVLVSLCTRPSPQAADFLARIRQPDGQEGSR